MNDSTILILGARSDIARALAREYAQNGHPLVLAARRAETLEADARDLEVRFGVSARIVELDALDFESHERFVEELGPVDGVICAIGYLGDQKRAETDFSESRRIIDTNYTGVVSLLNRIAAKLEAQKRGFVIGISSVAGDRGRQSNYLYGSAKAALTAYLSGLRNRLAPSGVQVLTVKPGFVRTRMTEGMALPGLLTAQPADVARDIRNAQRRGRNE
ncbi:MAG: SDR family oxidoreductase, partial [Myxococcales bacterium]|nr:SDR family oxidoreductase [Myxococcales bacterium]